MRRLHAIVARGASPRDGPFLSGYIFALCASGCKCLCENLTGQSDSDAMKRKLNFYTAAYKCW